MSKAKAKKAEAAKAKNRIAKIKANLKKHGSKDMSHVNRAMVGGWREGSDCWYIQTMLNKKPEYIATMLKKRNAKRYSDKAKTIRRVNTILKQAKMLGIKKAHA